MSSKLHEQNANTSKWRWPIDLTKYERRTSLSKQEAVALANLTSNRLGLGRANSIQWSVQARKDLKRLTLPINDALDVIAAQNQGDASISSGISLMRGKLLNIYVSVTQHLRRTCWSWKREDWTNIFDPRTLICGYKLLNQPRQLMLATGYLLSDRINLSDIRDYCLFQSAQLARKVFGGALVDARIKRVQDALCDMGYERTSYHITKAIPHALCYALLLNRSGYIEDLSFETLVDFREREQRRAVKVAYYTVSNALASLGLIPRPLLPDRTNQKLKNSTTVTDISPEWVRWAERWRETSTLAKETRNYSYYTLLKVGRWLAAEHPEIVSPKQWTRELAAEFASVIVNLKSGQFASCTKRIPREKIGKPQSPKGKKMYFDVMRRFFQDCQEWEWIPASFSALRYFQTPKSILALIGPNPRIIADDIWAKLLWAGLNLVVDDLRCTPNGGGPFYPLEMVRAVTVVWLFAALRSNEIYRLPLGCIRWQRGDVVIPTTGDTLSKDAVCWLDVPVNKTNTAFSKPVDRVVGEAIRNWEQVRPPQPRACDTKTGEMVYFLFSYRGRRIGSEYINNILIPILCHKAGVPLKDATGTITSHRARATIVSQLYNSDEPMSLEELRVWLGHKELYSTDHYAAKTPTNIAKSFSEAGYFERNLRTIKVLIDRDAVVSGAAASGEPWQYFDLGHGYCMYDFFAKCPHRMACAKCQFYLPKDSIKAQLIEAKSNLQHMLVSLPLTEEEREAVEEGIQYFNKLIEGLADVPTPAGPTPRELEISSRQLPVLTLTESVVRTKDDS
jgi:hypothetical protein